MKRADGTTTAHPLPGATKRSSHPPHRPAMHTLHTPKQSNQQIFLSGMRDTFLKEGKYKSVFQLRIFRLSHAAILIFSLRRGKRRKKKQHLLTRRRFNYGKRSIWPPTLRSDVSPGSLQDLRILPCYFSQEFSIFLFFQRQSYR